MKTKLFVIACTLVSLLSCKKKPVVEKKAPIASAADTTDAKGWNGLRDNINPASWQALDLK